MERLCGCATSKSLTFIYLFNYFLYIQDNTCTFEGTWKIWGPLWVLYFLSEGSCSLRAISCYPVNISILIFTHHKWKKTVNCFWISEFDVIYQARDAVFNHYMKHREESWKYDAQLSIFVKHNLLMKHCVKCLILLLKQNDFKRRN